MSKFFVKTEQINNNDIVIIGDDVNHIINVLRMKKTDEIQICNQDTGDNYNAEIVNYSKNEVECKIISKINETTESNVHITLFQGIPKFEKMELIIQKNTEVGIKSIVPVIMERTVVKLDEKIASKKLERWQKIAEIAAKQSMRDIIPQIGNITKLKDIDTTEFDAVLVAYENEEHNMLKTELQKLERKIKSNNSSEQQYNIAIVIGPEGGISEKELVMLAEKNAKFVSLGKRILRTETAGVVMAGNIIYELEYNS
ncbi:ribosomal RNA small subunit methyltransferase E [Clostridium sp. CAG:245]|jgi:RNA methyltransferase, rsmE family|nr:ribosomal RNA small subunit methyltransferase E [Clostridium sp. CAG:245]